MLRDVIKVKNLSFFSIFLLVLFIDSQLCFYQLTLVSLLLGLIIDLAISKIKLIKENITIKLSKLFLRNNLISF